MTLSNRYDLPYFVFSVGKILIIYDLEYENLLYLISSLFYFDYACDRCLVLQLYVLLYEWPDPDDHLDFIAFLVGWSVSFL